MATRQLLLRGNRVRRRVETKQLRPANDRPALRLHHAVEATAVSREPRGGGLGPGIVTQSAATDRDCRSRDRPWPRHRRKPGDVGRIAEREAEPQAGKAIKLSEGAQD